MRILLSAFACEAGRGSEPGIGWTWASGLARAGHEVWVITHSAGREANERACATMGLAGKLHFVFYDHDHFPKFFTKTHLGYYTYCQTWQVGAYRVAKRLHARLQFDTVHHVTFGTARFGSLMGRLGIPFTFGPVAGGERIPWRLRRSLPLTGKVRELVRDLHNLLCLVQPFTRQAFASAQRILVTNPETLRLVPGRYRGKCKVQFGIAADVSSHARRSAPGRTGGPFRALYVGVLQSRKGIHLALSAFAKFHHNCPNSEFTIVGRGVQEKWLRELAGRLGLNRCVHWVPWMPREKVLEIYGSHDVFLFPSLRDSGGMVVLEALANGLPVICLDLGGPGMIVDDSCGRVVSTCAASEEDVIGAIASQLLALARDAELREHLSRGALQRVQSFRWATLIDSVYAGGVPAQ
ncbi:MAG: glycosyltransferase family 4 protein [Terriglobales bacterium]